MKLWIGLETQADIVDRFRPVRKEVESVINAAIAGNSYDIEIEGWDVITILRNDADFDEVVKFSKARRAMDFRLRLDYTKIANANEVERKRLLFGLLVRSLLLLAEKGVNPSGIAQLIADVRMVGARNGWD